MFTGIIQALGSIKTKVVHDKGAVFSFTATNFDFSSIAIGDSIAVNGVCLTAVEVGPDFFKADVSQETLNCSIFSELELGDHVNLEKALRLNQGIDGHLVSGHVDGTAQVSEQFNEGESTRFKISAPDNLVKYIARKSSVCINGVSLTVNSIVGNIFDLNIVPHTLKVTTLGELKTGDQVNLEVDIIARHLEQLLNNK
ncbi:riboflavin synthase [Candidatus Thioglobus sp.]|nr:riboflavin synthase [Candidatus Thioglobus sp.]MDB3892920.1 riboflavin synthase [Candidatus Thioglobus sp.]MDC0904446.1 riboflavin synthase [Candidatus Thioglobus sp.]MDC0964863.1 riboflavin synthase [Candidatus Thioglobus sp.]